MNEMPQDQRHVTVDQYHQIKGQMPHNQASESDKR